MAVGVSRWLIHDRSKLANTVVVVVLAGTNGEAVTMTREEKIQLTKLTREVAVQVGKSDLPITVGCIGQSTKDVIADTIVAHEAGADFTLVLCPSYFHFAMNEDAVVGFFIEVSVLEPHGPDA